VACLAGVNLRGRPAGHWCANSRKAGRFGAILGLKRAGLRTKIDKNRKKSTKNEEDFQVDLLIMNGLSAILRQKLSPIFIFIHFLS
jgi:hypothetical protein